jgi:hypothetical protein
MPALMRLRQKNCMFKVSLGYMPDLVSILKK